MQSQPIQSQPDPSPLLEQLKDIHSVPEPGLWPPAPGWWFLAAIALIALLYMLHVAWQKYRVAQRRKEFIRVLNGLRVQFDPATSPHDYLAAMNRFFRAIALRAFPGTECNRLEGEAWVAFIRNLLPPGQDDESLKALAAGPYQSSPSFDPEGLSQCARSWVKRYG